MPESTSLVHRFWALIQARRWREAEALLAPQACCRWWSSRERFDGAAAIIHVNEVYPAGWTIQLLELLPLQQGRVLSLVRVDHGEAGFYAHSHFQIAAGRIQAIDEYWSDVQEPPAWRTRPEAPLLGHSRTAADRREGLPLVLDAPQPLPDSDGNGLAPAAGNATDSAARKRPA